MTENQKRLLSLLDQYVGMGVSAKPVQTGNLIAVAYTRKNISDGELKKLLLHNIPFVINSKSNTEIEIQFFL